MEKKFYHVGNIFRKTLHLTIPTKEKGTIQTKNMIGCLNGIVWNMDENFIYGKKTRLCIDHET